LSGAVAGAIITFGLFAFRPPAMPVQAQAQQPTLSPTPFDPGPEVEGPEVGEGISREGGVFINDLASKLNVPVTTLESDINSSFNVAANQAVSQGFLDQTTANQLTSREANLFTSGSGFIFDIDEFPPATNAIPVTGATLTPTSTATEEEVTATPNEEEENEKNETATKVESKEEEKEESVATENAESGEQHEVTPTVTPKPTHEESSPTTAPTATPRPTHTPRPTRTPEREFTATPMPSETPTPTLMPTQPEDFSLFYAP